MVRVWCCGSGTHVVYRGSARHALLMRSLPVRRARIAVLVTAFDLNRALFTMVHALIS